MIAEKVYTAPDVYLRQEREAEFKSEYVNGEIIYSSDQRVNVPTNSLPMASVYAQTEGILC